MKSAAYTLLRFFLFFLDAFIDFFAVDGDIFWGIDADPHLISANS